MFSSDDDVYFVMTEMDYQEIRGSVPVPTYAVDRRQWFDPRLRNLLDGSAFPQLILVSNRRP